MQKMQKFWFYRGIMWLLNSYKVTITDGVKNCQEKIEYAGKLHQGLHILSNFQIWGILNFRSIGNYFSKLVVPVNNLLLVMLFASMH